MIIDIDGRSILVPPSIEAKMVEQVYFMILGKYSTFPKPMRLAAKAWSRQALLKLEEELNKLGKDGKSIRPGDNDEATMHYLKIMLSGIQESLKDAIILCDTQEGTSTCTALSLSIQNPGKDGGQISFSGNERERENNSREDARQAVGDRITDESTLHL
jgi:hypothetical protein